MFGEAKEPAHAPKPSSAHFIGMGWLYALHARSSIARGKLWQAEYMISGVRDHALGWRAFDTACLLSTVVNLTSCPGESLRSSKVLPYVNSTSPNWCELSELRSVDWWPRFKVKMRSSQGRLREMLLGLSDIPL